jgi:hypothetical protein
MSKKKFGAGKNYINPDLRIQNMSLNDLNKIIRNSKITPLTNEQVERVKKMWPKLQKVEPRQFEEFLEGFTREGHPEREITIYEWIVNRLSENPTQNEYLKLIQLSFTQCPLIIKRDS